MTFIQNEDVMKKPKAPWETLRRVFKSGSSLVMTLPSAFIRVHNITDGDILKVIIGETLQVHPPDYRPKGRLKS
jgi:antitoxin component of MazEF toxin-antitoxin module